MKKLFNLIMAYVYQKEFHEQRRIREIIGSSWRVAYALANDFPENEEIQMREESLWKMYEQAQDETEKCFNTWAYYLHCSY